MLRPRQLLAVISVLLGFASSIGAQTGTRPIRVALLDPGETSIARKTAANLWSSLSSNENLLVLDREESGAAARGVGYAGSLNMTLQEARDLGAAVGCDFFLTGDAQTLRRSSSSKPIFFEAYASIFIVSGRSGRLIFWDRASVEASTSDEAERLMLTELGHRTSRYIEAIRTAHVSERDERIQALERVSAVIEDAPEDDEAATRKGIRLPQPYRRLRPTYPDTAARAEAEATVDVQLDLDVEGEISRMEIVRWGGFGLDEAALNTVRQLHFRPATLNSVPIPIRVLLRYNFLRPPREGKSQK